MPRSSLAHICGHFRKKLPVNILVSDDMMDCVLCLYWQKVQDVVSFDGWKIGKGCAFCVVELGYPLLALSAFYCSESSGASYSKGR